MHQLSVIVKVILLKRICAKLTVKYSAPYITFVYVPILVFTICEYILL